jgi:ATP-dependent DNA ligase
MPAQATRSAPLGYVNRSPSMANSKPPAPMEALLAAELPDGEGWQYEPKWDGFRCLAGRDGGEVELTSKSG